MKATTIVTVVSAIATVAAAGVAIYSKIKAEKIHEEFVDVDEDEAASFTAETVKEKVDDLNEALKTSATANRAAVTCKFVFLLSIAVPVIVYSLYYMNLGIVAHMAVKNKRITFEELVDFANGAVKEVS